MRLVVLVIIAFGLTACPFTVNQLNRLPVTQPLAQPVLFNRPSPLLHEASGFEFPNWYDNFQRVTAYRYDTGGLDVGIGTTTAGSTASSSQPSTCTLRPE